MNRIRVVILILFASFQLMAHCLEGTAGAEKMDFSIAYTVLKIERNATIADIKRAYRELAKRFHPDVAKGSGEIFLAIQTAYEVLKDPDTRAAYDRTLNVSSKSDWADVGSQEAPSYQWTGQAPSFTDALLKSGVYSGYLRNVLRQSAFDGDSTFRAWIGRRRIIQDAGAILAGGRGHWFFQGLTVILIVNIFYPAHGNSPLLGAEFLVGELIALCPFMTGLVVIPKSNLGKRDWKKWRDATAPDLSQATLALLSFDIFRHFISLFTASGKIENYAHLIQSELMRFSKKEPLIASGLLLRYLQSKNAKLLSSANSSQFGDHLTTWQKALELQMAARPRFWKQRAGELVEMLKSEPSPHAQVMLETALKLQNKLESTTILKTVGAKVEYKTRFGCEAALRWGDTFMHGFRQ